MHTRWYRGRVSHRCRDRRPKALAAHTLHAGTATTRVKNAPPGHGSQEMRNPCVTSLSAARKALTSTSLHTVLAQAVRECTACTAAGGPARQVRSLTTAVTDSCHPASGVGDGV